MITKTVGTGKDYTLLSTCVAGILIETGGLPFTEAYTVKVYGETFIDTVNFTVLQPTATFGLLVENAEATKPLIDAGYLYAHGFNMGSYITIKGIQITNTINANIIMNGNYNIITDCDIIFGNNGIYQGGGGTNNKYYNNRFINNYSFQFNSQGINEEVYNNIFTYNIGWGGWWNIAYGGNYWGAIGYNNKIYNNIMLGSYGGITFGYGTHDNEVYNNITKTTGVGIAIDSISGGAPVINIKVKNNIILADGNSATRCIDVDNLSGGGFVSDKNNFYNTFAAYLGNFAGTKCDNLSNWKTASGQDANSISLDPLFFNKNGTAITDFRLYYNSPCLAIGENLSAIFNFDINNTVRVIPFNLGANDTVIANPLPIITNQILDNYAPTQTQNVIATCNVSSSPASVIVKMNGKSFVMSLVSGTQYRVVIPAYLIGLCTAETVSFLATNASGGSDEIAPSTITVSANGNYDIALIEAAIINLITLYCPAIKTALNYEPKLIPELPAITLWYDGFDQTQTEAVSYTINHKWIMRLYVRLNDAKVAQDDVKALTKSILSAFKSDLNLSRTVLKETIPSAIVSAVLDQNNAVLIVEFNTTTMTEED